MSRGATWALVAAIVLGYLFFIYTVCCLFLRVALGAP